jgi:hypothetical protein
MRCTFVVMIRLPVAEALAGDMSGIERALEEERLRERALDREYWAPLRKELEQLRRERSRG